MDNGCAVTPFTLPPSSPPHAFPPALQVREGMAENDGCEYVVVVQQGAMKRSPQEEEEGQRREEKEGRQLKGREGGMQPELEEGIPTTWSPSLLWDRYQEEEGREGSGAGDGRQPLELDDLPLLPRNARYVMHVNECYDWGTFGWLLATLQVGWRGGGASVEGMEGDSQCE